ncbi:MAG: hypothetical protein ACUZ8O_06395 [Candidatus Anammoxibacter sp.]
MLRIVFVMCLTGMFLRPTFINAFEVAPRISDREIVERLTGLEEGQRNIETRFDYLRSEMNGRFNDLRSEMNSRFDTLQWMFGLFITIALVILGFVLRMQWQMQKRQTAMETSLETQKDEFAFIKGLIEKFLPPKGAL